MPAVAERLPWTLRAYRGFASMATGTILVVAWLFAFWIFVQRWILGTPVEAAA